MADVVTVVLNMADVMRYTLDEVGPARPIERDDESCGYLTDALRALDPAPVPQADLDRTASESSQ